MSDMIERVARAVEALGGEALGMPIYTPDYVAIARAAIAAMRNVPDDVLRAARSTADAGNCLSPHWPSRRDGVRDVWVSVIDAALDTPP